VITPTDLEKIAVIKAQLHAGEAETLAMAAEQRVDAVLVDDLQARHFATAMGLRVIGTAGILLLAHAKGITVDVKTMLDHMRRLGFRLREQIYRCAPAAAGSGSESRADARGRRLDAGVRCGVGMGH
jgi:predicted nucleic acid-binding protein